MIGYKLPVLTLVVSLIHLLVLIFFVLCRKHCEFKYFYPIMETIHHYLQVIVFISAMIFSVLTIVNTATDGCCEVWTWHIGLFSIIFGWTYLIHLTSTLPFVGEQAITFLDIFWTFCKLTIFASLLVVAATIVLAMTFYDAQAPVSSVLL